MGPESVKVRYLDTSALVMELVDDAGCADLRAFCNSQPRYQTNDLCVAEALGVLKRKWQRGQLTDERYFSAARQLTAEAKYCVYPTEPELTEHLVANAVVKLAQKHRLDIADGLLLYTMRHRPFHFFCDESASVLITGDEGLEAAAVAEGLRVWNCRKGPAPAWA